MSHYTFGDNPTAAQRLQFLSDLFEPSLDAFVREHVRARPRHLVDVGCGPGHSTRALAAVLRPDHVTGLDNSEPFIEEAIRTSPAAYRFIVHDITAPIAGQALGADLVYGRFLLTHLAQPGDALSTWAGYLEPGGLVLVQETAAMYSTNAALARYYELVAELQRRHGQRLDIGRSLPDLVDASRYHTEHVGTRTFTLPGASMARLHRMNLGTWRHDSSAASFDQRELDELLIALTRLSEGPPTAAEVNYAMGELVVRRR